MESVDVVARLKARETFAHWMNSIQERFQPSIDDFLATVSLGRRPGDRSVKAVKDAVWGMIDLSGRELLIVDSPPLQRLRHVRQLGVTYLTYPTAGYSRFEHTIGAMHQAERMLRAIAARSDASAEILENVPTVRLAGLLHDIGHLPLSHVSERFFTDAECVDEALLGEINSLRREISETLQVPTPRLSECLSLLFSLTPSFSKLLERAGYTADMVAEAVLAIVGRPPSLTKAFLAQVITNVIDADKLDYMFRDAFTTGVPLAVDLERLLFKLRCFDIDSQECPAAFREMVGLDGRTRVLGTDLAGRRHAYDLALSRAMLFERIYHHHKTLAAERVIIDILASLEFHPTRLLYEDDRFFSRYGATDHPPENRTLLGMLDRRDLPRRAFAVSYAFLLEQAQAEATTGLLKIPDDQREAWEEFNAVLLQARDRHRFRDQIVQGVAQLRTWLGEAPADCPVWADSMPEPFEVPFIDLWIEHPDGAISQGESFPSQAAAFAHNPHAIAYVFVANADEQLREQVFAATEIVLAKEYNLVFGRSAADHAKIRWRHVEVLKRNLEAVYPQVYRGCRLIRPKSAAVRTPRGRNRIQSLADRFRHFNTGSRVSVDESRIYSFLDQFPESLVEPMLKVIENVRFFDRDDLGKGFADAMKAGATASTKYVPLSKPLVKSASHLGYFLADDVGGPRPISLEQALAADGDITLFDDCVISGTQSRATLQTWFGLPTDVDEDLADQLTEPQRKALTGRQVRFRFLFGTQEGIGHFAKLARQLDLGDDIQAVHLSTAQPAISAILEEHDCGRLREVLADVGQALLASTKAKNDPTKWTQARCREFALGYGGLEQLIVLMYNTPTATITALWKSGDYQGANWLPLFPRRGES